MQSAKPRYQHIADQLTRQIRTGRIAVGAYLPTEQDLSARFDVSRGTVRQSLNLLEEAGLITRRRRSGTQVIARYPARGLVERMQLLEDWTRYGLEYPLEISSIEFKLPPAELGIAAKTRGKAPWLWISGLRHARNSRLPIAYCEAFVHPRYKEIEPEIDGSDPPIFALIEQRFGRVIDIIRTEMRGVLIDPATAATLGVAAGSAGLKMTRTFLDSNRSVVELTINIHPADRFTYAIDIFRAEQD